MRDFGDYYVVGEEYPNSSESAENEYWRWLNAAIPRKLTGSRNNSLFGLRVNRRPWP